MPGSNDSLFTGFKLKPKEDVCMVTMLFFLTFYITALTKLSIL